ncbi:unnamed protein product [Spirodela intermedia]|uniref:Uncharacterized protein n=1 Tax=Spirodela intermedia TaxID=51605 RepID=A0A7I8JX37_SPIIN|nr:unnamed protein product [Spirodela intermedia]
MDRPEPSKSLLSHSPSEAWKFCLRHESSATGENGPSAALSAHTGPVSSLALCGEFVLSASQAKDIIVWRQPDLSPFARFGHGDGSVKALEAVGNRVFTAHQDGRIRVWKVSKRSENLFRLVATLPTRKDCIGKLLKRSNYVQTRRNHRRLWVEHADSISCLAVEGGKVYSGSWDKTLKVWRAADLRCLESIRAHDDAINGLAVCNGMVYTASADGKIKAWENSSDSHRLKGVMEGRKLVSWNAVVLMEEGRLVYGGGSDGRVMGWGEEAGGREWRLLCDVKAHDMSVLCLCATGKFLCSGSADRSIGVWREMDGGLCRLRVLWGHEGPVKCLQSSWKGGGFWLYSGATDKNLRVWWVSEEENPQPKERGDRDGDAGTGNNSVKGS